MSKLLFVAENFKPFKGSWDVVCTPHPCKRGLSVGYYVPDGWQDELTLNGIAFIEVAKIIIDKPKASH